MMPPSPRQYLSYTGFSKIESCPKSYELEYIKRLRPKVQDERNTIVGNTLHNALEQWLKGSDDNPDWINQNLRELWHQKIEDAKLLIWKHNDDESELFDKLVRWGKSLTSVLGQYKISPENCEAELKGDVDITIHGRKLRLAGRIDVIKKNSKGQNIILDLKCSENRSIMKVDQLTWYSILYNLKFGADQEPVASGWILPAYRELVLHKISRTQQGLLLARIAQAYDRIQALDFPAIEEKSKCFFCPVASDCPAKNKIPPTKTGIIDLRDFIG